MARKRPFSTFNLSFLDIMSCGFGAVALIFLIIKHDVDNTIKQENNELLAEVQLLEEDIQIGQEGLVRARNTLSELDQQMAEATGLASRINSQIETLSASLAKLQADNPQDSVEALQQQLEELEQQRQALLAQQSQGNNVRQFLGQGNRQYLTGMKMDGARVLILLDASASMLDERLVNIIRRRNMDDASKRRSQKWQRSLATVEWLTARLPQQSAYQIYTFNTDVTAAISNTEGSWLEVENSAELEQAILNLRQRVPNKGTNLEEAFASINRLSPRPDNIFLITDGLPTRGSVANKSNKVSASDRIKLFNRAMDKLPSGIPINIILQPMEGDPMAAAAFWQMAQRNRGSFITPSEDWP
ncbi:MAG: hypothetical protein AseanaTS_05870 [Candidatus Pelagadaptatus aseana]|uniref:vWA domain-containing protein n=1 Tax=Candidatus Pelagadaptatus aseana TaxID=3120508 RepID=UPI0039B2CFAF